MSISPKRVVVRWRRETAIEAQQEPTVLRGLKDTAQIGASPIASQHPPFAPSLVQSRGGDFSLADGKGVVVPFFYQVDCRPCRLKSWTHLAIMSAIAAAAAALGGRQATRDMEQPRAKPPPVHPRDLATGRLIEAARDWALFLDVDRILPHSSEIPSWVEVNDYLRDGINLVAKEYVAAQRSKDPGVLVLSRFAEAAQEPNGALIVNPLIRKASPTRWGRRLRCTGASAASAGRHCTAACASSTSRPGERATSRPWPGRLGRPEP